MWKKEGGMDRDERKIGKETERRREKKKDREGKEGGKSKREKREKYD